MSGIITPTGPATVLHRLALGVEIRDALLDRFVSSPVRVGLQTPAPSTRLRPRDWPCRDLEACGPARFRLRHVPALPSAPVLRLDDVSRRFVPRRFSVHPWPVATLDETTGQPYIAVAARLLRAWLWPGAAYPLPRGATAIRGRITHDGLPARWARVTAIGPTNLVAGRAHVDDRGEFLLVVTEVGQNPLQSTVSLRLRVRAPAAQVAADPADRCADLTVEDVPRSTAPPLPVERDNDVLRGVAAPPGHVTDATGPRLLTVTVGAELTLTDDIVFVPQP